MSAEELLKKDREVQPEDQGIGGTQGLYHWKDKTIYFNNDGVLGLSDLFLPPLIFHESIHRLQHEFCIPSCDQGVPKLGHDPENAKQILRKLSERYLGSEQACPAFLDGETIEIQL